MNSIENSFMKPHRSNYHYLESQQPEKVTSNPESINEKKIEEVWSKHNFDTNKVNVENLFNNVKTTWGVSSGEDDAVDKNDDIQDEDMMDNTKESKSVTDPDEDTQVAEDTSPSHHARRPPNAFLIFCKKHRPIVRQRYPTTENRGVTKILGEWWALLNAAEKQPYNDLAKEYKDAFLSANPDFRWYKLPAPPLRTLTTRPTTITSKSPPSAAMSSPPTLNLPEFTPGKLADESQLGGLTSLMNNNYAASKKSEQDSPCCTVEDNNNENPETEWKDTRMEQKIQEMFSSPTNVITKVPMPPKPIKKRIFQQFAEEKACQEDKNGNFTNQEFLNKVVDGIFASEEPKEQRKSDRMCKGKRYERFMFEGKLLGNKRDTKLTQHHRVGKTEQEVTKPTEQETTKFNLENTIKRLAERTNTKIDDEDLKPKVERVRTISETSEGAKSSQVNFNLDLRIEHLPSLSYDDFIRRKRDTKKRKLRIKTDSTHHHKMQRLENNNSASKPEMHSPPVAVGSKKRKNKQSIMHLSTSEAMLRKENALLGLATLAMVAASTEKIEENL